MNGTFDAILEANPQWAYLAGRADPPPVKARPGRRPLARMYARADHQTLVIPAVTDGETADDDRPPRYEVGGKLREWCDTNCYRETQAEPKTGNVPAGIQEQQLAAYRHAGTS